jgi:dipeptide/tripeptide permease
VQATGNIGAILATTPLALSMAQFGWRMSFDIAAALTFAGCLWAF